MSGGLADEVKNAATAGDVAALKQFVATLGAAAVRLDENTQELTALHWAAASGVVEAVNYLLAPPVQADPRAARTNNFTPLHAAAMQGHAEVCEVLLTAGAAVNCQATFFSPVQRQSDFLIILSTRSASDDN
jgi:ankyrin repeat protein